MTKLNWAIENKVVELALVSASHEIATGDNEDENEDQDEKNDLCSEIDDQC